jgi:hypothetical protein
MALKYSSTVATDFGTLAKWVDTLSYISTLPCKNQCLVITVKVDLLHAYRLLINKHAKCALKWHKPTLHRYQTRVVMLVQHFP